MDERYLVRNGPLVENNNDAELRAYRQQKEKARRQRELEQRVDRLESMIEDIHTLLTNAK